MIQYCPTKPMILTIAGGKLSTTTMVQVQLPSQWMISILLVLLAGMVFLFFRFNVLSYNRDIMRELLRQILRKLRKKEKVLIIREQGKEILIPTTQIQYVKSAGNYIEIHTPQQTHLIRGKISSFPNMVPDPLEFIRVHRSYIVRLDHMEQKNKKKVKVNGTEIPIGDSYRAQLPEAII